MTPEEGRELKRQVAEGMGYSCRVVEQEPIRVEEWTYPDGKTWNYYPPDFIGEEWWQVVEWLRGQDDPHVRSCFIAALGDYQVDATLEYNSSLGGFLMKGNPGVAICKAFVEVMKPDA